MPHRYRNSHAICNHTQCYPPLSRGDAPMRVHYLFMLYEENSQVIDTNLGRQIEPWHVFTVRSKSQRSRSQHYQVAAGKGPQTDRPFKLFFNRTHVAISHKTQSPSHFRSLHHKLVSLSAFSAKF